MWDWIPLPHHPQQKDKSAFLAWILENKAVSPLIPETRSSRGNHNATRGLQTGRAKAGSCPSVWANGTSYSEEKELPRAVWKCCKEPIPTGNRSPDSCSSLCLSTNGVILPKKVCLWVCRVQIWWGSKSTITFLWQQHLRTSPQSSRQSSSNVTCNHKSHSLTRVTTVKAETNHFKKDKRDLQEGSC